MLFGKAIFLYEPFCIESFAPAKKNALKIIQALLKNNNASLRAVSKKCVDKRIPPALPGFYRPLLGTPIN
jgi:3-methyladenine DNA glycosylase AlkC